MQGYWILYTQYNTVAVTTDSDDVVLWFLALIKGSYAEWVGYGLRT